MGKEGARPQLQLRTGASNESDRMTDDILAHLPRWRRWALGAALALTITGVLPMIAANVLIWAVGSVIL